MSAVQDGGYQGTGPTSGSQDQGFQSCSDLIVSSNKFRLIPDRAIFFSRVVGGRSVDAVCLTNVRLPRRQVIHLLQGMSALSVLGILVVHGKKYLPIIADGFCAYDPPVRFRRVIAGVPTEEPIPLEDLVVAFINSP